MANLYIRSETQIFVCCVEIFKNFFLDTLFRVEFSIHSLPYGS